MQNYVYRSKNEACNAQTGKFELVICSHCGFVHNMSFDEKLLQYDENYDNSVPSKVFEKYYEEIATFLYDNFSLENGTVIDIGCGKGTFLKHLCAKYPTVKGIGIDPSYETHSSLKDDKFHNIDFIKDYFKAEHVKESPSLVICRHVIEHIFNPTQFLKNIYFALENFQDVPIFIEVPDLEWILDENAFWDFCYEHCNYFTIKSITYALELSGFSVGKTFKSFGEQYIWVIATNGNKQFKFDTERYCATREAFELVEKLKYYTKKEKNIIEKAKFSLKLVTTKQNKTQTKIIVWGMATKGIIFVNLVDLNNNLINYCVDINPSKQNCFVPHTGHKICPPEDLMQESQSDLAIIIMNLNYFDEIKSYCENLHLLPVYFDAHFNKLI
nr:class I SAM-dependent methyltransferase [Thiotrichaceae bacterium]